MQPADYPKQAEDAFNRRDLAALGALWSPAFHYVAPGEESTTREAALLRERALFEALPDIRADLCHHRAGAETLAIEGVLTGTHTGVLRLGGAELAPSGRSVTLRFAAFFRFADGVAATERIFYDRLDLLAQLGVSV